MKIFTNLYAQLASVAVVFVAGLLNPVIGIVAFLIYGCIWAFNYTKNFK